MGIESILAKVHNVPATNERPESFFPKSSDWNLLPIPTFSSQIERFIFSDSVHIFEVEKIIDSADFSIRFALCHPNSIREAFWNLIHTLMAEHTIRVQFCEDCETAPEWFASSTEWRVHREAILEYIEQRHKLWCEEFGTEEFSGTIADAMAKFVFPRSRPADYVPAGRD